MMSPLVSILISLIFLCIVTPSQSCNACANNSCVCDNDELSISCVGLEQLTVELFKNCHHIKLSIYNSFISELTELTLANISSLRALRLINNTIHHMHRNALLSLKNLQFLILHKNNIFHCGGFSSTSLRFFYCVFNVINNSSIIDNGTLDLPYLQAFTWKNSIESIPVGIFYSLNSLSKLVLNHNRLTFLQDNTFTELTKLKFLSIAFNNLVDIAANAFSPLVNLEELKLQDNQLETLPEGLFSKLTELTFLDLSRNKIKTLDVEILYPLGQLIRLVLKGNPLKCDCKLREVWLWCSKQTYSLPTTCTEPPKFAGRYWTALKKLKCEKESATVSAIAFGLTSLCIVTLVFTLIYIYNCIDIHWRISENNFFSRTSVVHPKGKVNQNFKNKN